MQELAYDLVDAVAARGTLWEARLHGGGEDGEGQGGDESEDVHLDGGWWLCRISCSESLARDGRAVLSCCKLVRKKESK